MEKIVAGSTVFGFGDWSEGRGSVTGAAAGSGAVLGGMEEEVAVARGGGSIWAAREDGGRRARDFCGERREFCEIALDWVMCVQAGET